MASGLLIKQKQLLAGDGIAINHGETASTISLAENALENAVRIYDATVEEETGVITITDGTQVSELAIGDEIRTPDGVYQKTKDDITTGSIPDDGSHILISGCTDPTAVNGMYVATGEPNTWKNETGNYWISKLDGYGGPWWFIASSQAPANPGASSIHYRAIAAIAQNPWDANFTPSHATGAISVQKYSDLVSKTDTIDLFEYASLPVEPANIVQSVNGKKPDASGNVTIETSSGGLTSVSVGNGLTGNGTSSSPIKLDLSNAVMEHNCAINAQGNTFTVGNLTTASIQTTNIDLAVSSEFLLQVPGHNVVITINADGIDIQTTAIRLNSCSQNTAGGFAIVGEDGKLPSSIIPVSSNRHSFTSSDLSSNVLTITTTGNVTGVIDDSGKAWNFADEEVTYTDSTVSVDLSGVFARKGIDAPAGTWKLMLYGA